MPVRYSPYYPAEHTGDVFCASDGVSRLHVKAPTVVERQRNGSPTVKNTWKTTETLREPSETAGEIFVRYITERYPRHAAKLVAKDARCQVRTAEGWLQERKLPNNKHLFRLIDKYGDDFVAALLSSVNKRLATRQNINDRIAKIHRELNELKELTRTPRG